MDAEVLAARRRSAGLREEAERARTVADGLAQAADEVEHRLDPVIDGLGPEVWAGRAASVAAAAAEDAREDLALAAGSLREVVDELRLASAVLEWRARPGLVASRTTFDPRPR